MTKYSSVLRIQGAGKYHVELKSRFGKENCSEHRAGDSVESEFSFVPIKYWPYDVIIVTPIVNPELGIFDQIDWICQKLERHEAFLLEIIANGVNIDISCCCYTDQNIGDLKISSSQIKNIAKFGISFFSRFVVNEVFVE